MRKSRFSEEQIVRIIQEYAAGAKVSELCRKHGMSDATFYKWKVSVRCACSDVRRSALIVSTIDSGHLEVGYVGQEGPEETVLVG